MRGLNPLKNQLAPVQTLQTAVKLLGMRRRHPCSIPTLLLSLRMGGGEKLCRLSPTFWHLEIRLEEWSVAGSTRHKAQGGEGIQLVSLGNGDFLSFFGIFIFLFLSPAFAVCQPVCLDTPRKIKIAFFDVRGCVAESVSTLHLNDDGGEAVRRDSTGVGKIGIPASPSAACSVCYALLAQLRSAC